MITVKRIASVAIFVGLTLGLAGCGATSEETPEAKGPWPPQPLADYLFGTVADLPTRFTGLEAAVLSSELLTDEVRNRAESGEFLDALDCRPGWSTAPATAPG